MEASSEAHKNNSSGEHSLPDPLEKELVFEDAVSGPIEDEQPGEIEEKKMKEENPLSKEELESIAYAEKFRTSKLTDDYKDDLAYRKGGLALHDKDQASKLRSSGMEVVKQIGYKIFKADFNLTAISFPIKCMEPKTILEVLPLQQKVNWYYLNYAASVNDPVERLKAFMTANVVFLLKGNSFEKPLNPVLGETF